MTHWPMAKGRLMTRATFRGNQIFDVDRYPRGDFPQIHNGGYLIATECGTEVGKEKLAMWSRKLVFLIAYYKF